MELRSRWRVLMGFIALIGVLIIALRISSYSSLRVKYFPSPDILLKVNLGHKHTLADYYFLYAIQYAGELSNRGEEYRWLYPVLNIITTLDPKYGTPYRWGGIMLPLFNGNEWVNVVESNKLLEKGLRDLSREDERYWQIAFYLGWNAMSYEKDYKKAADYMAMASRFAKRGVYPKYLALLATRLYATADELDSGLRIAEDAYRAESDPDIKKELKKRIRELRVEAHLNTLRKAIKEYKNKFSRNPRDLSELVEVGLIKEIPVEPFGGKYIIDEAGSPQSTTYKGSLRIDLTELERKIEGSRD